MKDMYPLRYNKNVLTGPFIIQTVNEVTGGDAAIVTEVGQHQMWAAQYYKYRQPRTLLTSGGLGTMGYGLGASIGAKMGCKDKTVINIAGDGCFRMNMNEIATATRYNISDRTDHQQPCIRYGASVADSLLWKALFSDCSQ